MTGVVIEPQHVHGHSYFERVEDGYRAHCMCGAFWTGETKPVANKALGKHLRERAREFRKLRAGMRGAS